MHRTFNCFLVGTLFSLSYMQSCQNGNKAVVAEDKITTSVTEFVSPANGSRQTAGDIIPIKVSVIKGQTKPDSIRLVINDMRVVSTTGSTLEYSWDTKSSKVGRQQIIAESFDSSGKKTDVIAVTILSDIKPVVYTYKVVHVYPHDENAYTQGLIYEDGVFYESDGQYRESSLRKVKATSGEVLDIVQVDDKIFAEGIAIHNNKIYQLSWREQVCMVYDKSTLALEKQMNYSIAEGWGLATNGKQFLMSDGSNAIYVVEPENFAILSKVEVMDNNGPKRELNELEYIEGDLYANVYQTDTILIIEPQTGKVKGKIDLTGILPKEDYTNKTDVLNGIAYNKASGNLYVTGKRWPKLFEIKLLKK